MVHAGKFARLGQRLRDRKGEYRPEPHRYDSDAGNLHPADHLLARAAPEPAHAEGLASRFGKGARINGRDAITHVEQVHQQLVEAAESPAFAVVATEGPLREAAIPRQVGGGGPAPKCEEGGEECE